MRSFRQFSAHLTKCHACHEIYTLSPLDAALPMRFAKNTQQDTSEVLRLPRQITMDTSKVLRLPWKLQHIFWKRRKSIPHKMAFATLQETSECHEVPHLPRETKQRDVWNIQKWPLLHRHGHTASRERLRTVANGCGRLRTVANGCERLRTVANVNTTSSEHTLNPQTPRVKREPLLRIREK